MKAVTTSQVLGVSSVNVDGKVYSSIFLGQSADEASTSSKGIEVMKVTCDLDVFNALPRTGYPLQCEVELEFRKAGGGKMGQHCVKASVSRQAAKA